MAEKGYLPLEKPDAALDGPGRPRLRWTDEQVQSQLDRILDHPEFHATARMREFLRFVVEQTLAGNARHLKGFTIARAVFGRDETFDAAHDPVVRIQAGRLRRAIERYYLVAGKNDPIRIDIPKGGYVPVFSDGAAADFDRDIGAEPSTDGNIESWPSILIQPFVNLTESDELSFLGMGLATDLAIELGNCADLRVMLPSEQLDRMTAGQRPDFIVCGSIRASAAQVKVVAQLVYGDNAEQLWTDTIRTKVIGGDLVAFQENAAAAISAHIASEHGVIYRTLTRHLPLEHSMDSGSYEAVLRGYAYHQTANFESFVSALESLRKAHERDPHSGLVCSMLAYMYFDNISMEFFEPGRFPLDEALRLAHEGALLEPHNQFSLLALARGHMLEDNYPAALAQVEAALALCPKSLLYMDVIGYLLVLLGEWDRGEQLIRKAIELNPFYRVLVRYSTWLNCFRQHDYEGAMDELAWINGEGYFWGPLCRAVTLGQLGRLEECRSAVEELLALKPDFRRRGHVLMRHYIKFPEILDRCFEGLAAGGLELEHAPD